MSDEPEDQNLASRIEERMEILNLNPYSTALKAGLGADYVRDILRGKVKKPSAEKLGKLAVALECSLYYLLSGKPLRVESTQAQWDSAPIDDDIEISGSILVATTTMLEVRHELIAGAYRDATEVTGRALGSEPASIPEQYLSREQWFEIVRDNTMELVAPAGSLVHVVEWSDTDRESLQHGDIVVVVKRIIEHGAAINIVERSLRRVVHRYPDLGLWFLEYFGPDEEMNLTDDIFRQDMDEVAKSRLAQAEQRRKQEPREPSEAVKAALHRMDQATKAEIDEAVRIAQNGRAKIAGKVIRVITPLDKSARFTVASRIV